MYETDRKAWIRYPPPRWIWRGTAICGVPGEVSRAMLRGWHANNGAALGNLKLGFVCNKQSVDGQDGLEGYYYESDHPLELDQRLVFARHLEAPLFDPAKAPALPVDSWPKPRLEKAYRNYAMEYVKTAAPVMVQVFGPEDAGYLLHLTGKLIGMQYFDEIARALQVDRGGAKEFVDFLRVLFDSQDDVFEISESSDSFEVRQQSWKLMEGVSDYSPACRIQTVRAGAENVRHRRCRNSRRRGRTPAAATGAAGEECACRRADPAHAADAGLAEHAGAHRRHLRRHRGDLLYRPARRR